MCIHMNSLFISFTSQEYILLNALSSPYPFPHFIDFWRDQSYKD